MYVNVDCSLVLVVSSQLFPCLSYAGTHILIKFPIRIIVCICGEHNLTCDEWCMIENVLISNLTPTFNWWKVKPIDISQPSHTNSAPPLLVGAMWDQRLKFSHWLLHINIPWIHTIVLPHLIQSVMWENRDVAKGYGWEFWYLCQGRKNCCEQQGEYQDRSVNTQLSIQKCAFKVCFLLFLNIHHSS